MDTPTDTSTVRGRHPTPSGPQAPLPKGPSDAERARERERNLAAVRRVSRVLDSAFRIPGTRVRFGWDSIIGLIPGAGDLATGVVTAWTIGRAREMGAPRSILVKMAANAGIDVVVGSVPLLGDAFDVYFKANQRNVALLESWLEKPGGGRGGGEHLRRAGRWGRMARGGALVPDGVAERAGSPVARDLLTHAPCKNFEHSSGG